MGVSFYAIIEYKQYNSYFAFSKAHIPRGDELLPAIVFGNEGVTDNLLYPPRGMPSDFSYEVRSLFFTDVATVEDCLENYKDDEDEDELTVEKYLESSGKWAVEQFKTNGLLPGPESYEPGWLTFAELQEVLVHEKISLSDLSPECRAWLAAMESLSQDFGTENVRLVFWCGM